MFCSVIKHTMSDCSENSALVTLDGADTTKSTYQSVGFGNSFAFKFEHPNGNVRRFYCGK